MKSGIVIAGLMCLSLLSFSTWAVEYCIGMHKSLCTVKNHCRGYTGVYGNYHQCTGPHMLARGAKGCGVEVFKCKTR
jgi:hypothetical protein